MQCDGNGNANADDRGDYNSSPCTSYRRSKNVMSVRLVRQFCTIFFSSVEYQCMLVKAIPISSDQGMELLKVGVDPILISL